VPTPSGRRFTQALAAQWAGDRRLVFACGRYEGIDSRVVPWARTLTAGGVPVAVDEVSLGDYVLAGAEAAVLVMVEAVGRLIPGVLGNEASHADDSFASGGMEDLLEGPVYTRPPVWEGMAVPEVLTSGDHGAVARWRHEQARERTRQMRPDLLG
jgi:tRNA (guanine37-N1)-methyltransferase